MQMTQHIGRVAELRRRRTENDSLEGLVHSLKAMNIFAEIMWIMLLVVA